MDLSGINFRSVAESEDYSFNTSFSLEGATGVAEFSLSGQNNKIKFDFKSGKVYDDDGSYIYSYKDAEEIEISGDVSTTKYSYYVNDEYYYAYHDYSNASYAYYASYYAYYLFVHTIILN